MMYDCFNLIQGDEPGEFWKLLGGRPTDPITVSIHSFWHLILHPFLLIFTHSYLNSLIHPSIHSFLHLSIHSLLFCFDITGKTRVQWTTSCAYSVSSCLGAWLLGATSRYCFLVFFCVLGLVVYTDNQQCKIYNQYHIRSWEWLNSSRNS